MDLTTILIIAVVVALGLIVFFNRKTGADVDQDGDVDLQDAKKAVENTVEGVKEVASKVAGEVAETATEVVEKVKKPRKKKEAVDLSAMKKDELLAHAKDKGVKANASMNKQEIIDAINNG